ESFLRVVDSMATQHMK
ncbi:hypothetical protein CP01DC11_1444B, partial [Chlamydia psittaci 01DC11]